MKERRGKGGEEGRQLGCEAREGEPAPLPSLFPVPPFLAVAFARKKIARVFFLKDRCRRCAGAGGGRGRGKGGSILNLSLFE